MKLGIISDIHEDIRRLEQALDLLAREGCDEIACLGDMAGFSIPSFGFFESRDASACLELVKEKCRYIVAGNHDLFPARKIPDHIAGFRYPDDWYALDYPQRKALAGEEVWLNEEIDLDALLSGDQRAFLGGLPEYVCMNDGRVNILLSHYLYPDLTGSTRTYFETFGPVEGHLDFMEKNNCRIGFSGHLHAEGMILSTREGTTPHGFGSYRLGEGTQWVVGPCIANGKKENGCMILDTDALLLKVIPLETPPRIMKIVDFS